MNKYLLSLGLTLLLICDMDAGDFSSKKRNIEKPEEKRLTEEIHIKTGRKIIVAQVTDKAGAVDIVTHFNVDNNELQISCTPKSGVGAISFQLDGIESLTFVDRQEVSSLDKSGNIVLQTNEGTFIEGVIKEPNGVESANMINSNMIFSGYRKGTKNKHVWMASNIKSIKILDTEQVSTGESVAITKKKALKKKLINDAISLDQKIDAHEQAEVELENTELGSDTEVSWFWALFARKAKRPLVVINFEDLPESFKKDYCPVCLDYFNETKDAAISKTHCKHYFHKKCLNKWLSRKKSVCPMCRRDLGI